MHCYVAIPTCLKRAHTKDLKRSKTSNQTSVCSHQVEQEEQGLKLTSGYISICSAP